MIQTRIAPATAPKLRPVEQDAREALAPDPLVGGLGARGGHVPFLRAR